MEFDVVFLIGMNEGTFPDYRAHGRALEKGGAQECVCSGHSLKATALYHISQYKSHALGSHESAAAFAVRFGIVRITIAPSCIRRSTDNVFLGARSIEARGEFERFTRRDQT